MGQLDQRAAGVEHETAHLDAPSGERQDVEPGAREAAVELGAPQAQREVGAPVGAEVEIDVVVGRRDPQHAALDDLEAADRIRDPERAARREGRIGPEPAPLRPCRPLERQHRPGPGDLARAGLDQGEPLLEQHTLQPFTVSALDLGDQIAVAIDRGCRRVESDRLAGQQASEARPRLLAPGIMARGQADAGEADRTAVGQLQPVAGEHPGDRERRAPVELFGAGAGCAEEQAENDQPYRRTHRSICYAAPLIRSSMADKARPQQSRPRQEEETSLLENRGWRGLFVAIATPIGAEDAPDLARLAARAAALLAQGCDGIALFGTTGEGPAFPVASRCAGLEALLAAGIPPDRLVVSASATAPADALTLTRHAQAAGVHDVLLTPAFFHKAVDDEGLFRFYADHIERAADAPLRLLLYHIPSVTGIGLGLDLIARLAAAFPGVVIGVKDSGFDWDFTRSLLERFPGLEILTGEESHLPQALALGGAGTICGMANFMAPLLRRLIDSRDPEASAALLEALVAVGRALERAGSFHQGLRALVADQTGEPAWLRCLPPMSPLVDDRRRALVSAFRRLAKV